MEATKKNTYEVITDKVLELLGKGKVPWRKPWSGGKGGMPCNLVSKKPYRGCNLFLLACAGYDSPYWLTFKQAKELGGSVRRGEKGMPVMFWLWPSEDKKDKKDNKEEKKARRAPVAKRYTVFNVEQCEGLADKVPAAAKPDTYEHNPIPACEEIVKAYHGPSIEHCGSRAFYRPTDDTVSVPAPERFLCREEYFSTVFHELGHSTGHESRLNRKFGSSFGDHAYSQEELVAEMVAAFLCGVSGIETATIENSAAYIQGWSTKLKADPRIIVQAGAQAQRAADLILGTTYSEE